MFKRGSYFYYALSNGMFYFSWGMFASIISVFLAGKNCSATQISLITSAASLFAMVFQPVTGFLADKIQSPKKVATVCLALATICGIGFAYSNNFILLFLMNGLAQGFLNGTVALSDRLAVASPFPFGTIRFWGSLLYAIAAQLSGFVYDNISPVMNYYIFAFGLIITVFGFIGMKDAIPNSSSDNQVTIGAAFKTLIHNKKFVLFTAINCLYMGSHTAQFTYMPLFIKQLGGTTTLVGTTLLLSTLFEIPAVFFSDRIFKKISYRNLMVFACGLTILRYVWYSTLPSPNAIMAAFFFQGLTSIVMILVSVRIVIDIVDENYVNSAYGISAMLARGLFALTFVIGFGRILDMFPGTTGFQYVYWIISVTNVIALILATRFKTD